MVGLTSMESSLIFSNNDLLFHFMTLLCIHMVSCAWFPDLQRNVYLLEHTAGTLVFKPASYYGCQTHAKGPKVKVKSKGQRSKFGRLGHKRGQF